MGQFHSLNIASQDSFDGSGIVDDSLFDSIDNKNSTEISPNMMKNNNTKLELHASQNCGPFNSQELKTFCDDHTNDNTEISPSHDESIAFNTPDLFNNICKDVERGEESVKNVPMLKSESTESESKKRLAYKRTRKLIRHRRSHWVVNLTSFDWSLARSLTKLQADFITKG
eukprot:UN26158